MTLFVKCLFLLFGIVYTINDFSTCVWELDDQCWYGTFAFVRKAFCERDNGTEEFMLKIPRSEEKAVEKFEVEYNFAKLIEKEAEKDKVAEYLVVPLNYIPCQKGILNAFKKPCKFEQELQGVLNSGESYVESDDNNDDGAVYLNYTAFTDDAHCLVFTVANQGSYNDKYFNKYNDEDDEDEDDENDENKKLEENKKLKEILNTEISANYIGWLIQVAKAVKILSDNGFIHRDIHPGNLLINKNDVDEYNMLLADFGEIISVSNIQLIDYDDAGLLGIQFYTSPEFMLYMGKVWNEYGTRKIFTEENSWMEDIQIYGPKSDVYMLGASFIIILLETSNPQFTDDELVPNTYTIDYLKIKLEKLNGIVNKFEENLSDTDDITDIDRTKNKRLIKLLRDMIKPNPDERVSIDQVVEELDAIETYDDDDAYI
eukprot:GHVR01091099.1.p1 GENE.GHVR01091099.1~~GHVR01091099.1.p1  ORF type:complete len:429 (+),score=87.44 GHVR01091099.1:21-1307(+)